MQWLANVNANRFDRSFINIAIHHAAIHDLKVFYNLFSLVLTLSHTLQANSEYISSSIVMHLLVPPMFTTEVTNSCTN